MLLNFKKIVIDYHQSIKKFEDNIEITYKTFGIPIDKLCDILYYNYYKKINYVENILFEEINKEITYSLDLEQITITIYSENSFSIKKLSFGHERKIYHKLIN